MFVGRFLVKEAQQCIKEAKNMFPFVGQVEGNGEWEKTSLLITFLRR